MADRAFRQSLAAQIGPALVLELADDPVEPREIGEHRLGRRVEQDHRDRPFVDVQLGHVAGAESGENRAVRRGQDLVDPEVAGDPAAVQRAVAAVGQHGELLRQVAADAQLLGHPVGHLLIHLGPDQPRHLDRFGVDPVAELLLDRELGPRAVELDLAARVPLRGEVAEQQVRVGNGGQQPATVVAGGAGVASA